MGEDMITILIKIAASLVLGVLAGFGAVYIFNKMPAAWLTDYDAKPPAELTDPHIQRVKGFPWRWIYAAGFSCLFIGLADLKYMIIPDQFVIMLAISAFGFIPYQSGLMQPLLGALVGGGVMLMVGVLGGAAFKKEVLGFGDVKLFACLGLALGLTRTVVVLIGASLLSGIGAAIALASGRAKKDDAKPLGPYICGMGIFYIFIVWPFL